MRQPPFTPGALLLALGLVTPAARAEAPSTAASPVFTLGQITVTAAAEDDTPVDADIVDRETLWDFDKDGLSEALNLVPGVFTTTGAGSRNEALISVRGFDRWQVPLMMDGIRLYLPADNRIDFDRFLTPDLSEIQVSKGYVSVINGPGGMGGAINLVTRKPTEPFEAELRGAMALGSGGQYNGTTAYANVGTRQEAYYAQVSIEQRDIQGWRVSDDFSPTVAEDGGERDNTGKKDWRINMKVGITPNATDEYSLNFVRQSGQKHGIGSVTGTSTLSTWDWPKWDTTSIYWLSHTQLGERSWLKTKAYYNTFENDLVAFTNVSLTTPQWTSYYDDNAKGVSVELGTEALAQQTLKAAVHYRRDDHTEWQLTHASGFVEPRQQTVEDTYSVALEDTWHVTPALDVVGGISQDWRHTIKAEEYRSSDGLFDQPTDDSEATNYQAAVIYRYSDTGRVHTSASRRTRFPTMFERFSSRFGGALSNPWLDPERALNLEVGISDRLAPGLHGELTVFRNRVEDAIQSVPITYMGGNYSQSQNVGEAVYQGIEAGLTAQLAPSLEVGGNYTYMDTRIDNPNDDEARLSTTPQHKAFLYARWRPLDALRVIPSVEYASPRWSPDAVINNRYVHTGEYALVNLKLEYQLTQAWDVSLTGRNLLDQDYALVDGYPQEGRNFIVATRLQF